jgi:hypothetical protein
MVSPSAQKEGEVMDSTTMKGTVQWYFDRAFDEMTDKELETPLVNSGLGVKAEPADKSSGTGLLLICGVLSAFCVCLLSGCLAPYSV